jgi:two-component system NarL family sensor kinase
MLTIENRYQSKIIKQKMIQKQLAAQLQIERQDKYKRLSQHQRELIETALISQENERKKIAQDIHDSFGSMLWAIKVNLQHISKNGNLAADFQHSAYECNMILEDAIDMARLMVKNMSPKTLEIYGLTTAVAELCDRMSKSNAFSIKFRCKTPSLAVNKERELMIYRTIQELLNNCVRHSSATYIYLELIWGPMLCITLMDNGCPFEYNFRHYPNSAGFGVLNLKSRIELLNGSVNSFAGPPNTTQLFVPINNINGYQKTSSISC